MDIRDTLSAELPAPRDDEPGGLRADILDELADHLACSYNRELLRGAAPEEARRRAIERFGDPSAVARRLWFDAMRGKIMAQRFLIATCLVVMAAFLGIVWYIGDRSSRAAREVAEANRRVAELLGANQATNQEMLRQLQAMAKPAAPSKSADWIPVSFKLTVETPEDLPAVGYEVILGRGHGGALKDDAIHRLSDASGMADFGVVQPGDWEFLLRAGSWRATGSLNAVPNQVVQKAIACPKDPPDPAQVRVRVDWPAGWKDRGYSAVAIFGSEDITFQPPLRWSRPDRMEIICKQGEEASVADRFVELETRDVSLKDQELIRPMGFGTSNGNEVLRKNRIFARRPSGPSIHDSVPIEMGAGRYSLKTLILFRPQPGQKATDDTWELLALMDRDDQGMSVKVPVEINQMGGGMMGGGMMNSIYTVFWHGVPVRRSILDRLDAFEARPDQTAEWVIPVPEEMVREAERRSSMGDAKHGDAKPVVPG